MQPVNRVAVTSFWHVFAPSHLVTSIYSLPIIKGCAVFLVTTTYIVTSYIGRFLYREGLELRLFQVQNTSYFSRLVLRALGIRTSLTQPISSEKQPFLVVSNHLSYLDVLVIAAQYRVVFVTSVEVENAKFLGLMAKCAGSLFVERRTRANLVDEISTMVAALKEGFSVVIFPEGTTSNGSSVLPFRVSLIDAAIRGEVDVLPMCINYIRADGRKISPETRDKIFYYGDMNFFAHLKSLLSLRSVEVRLTPFPALSVNTDSCRREIGDVAYQSIAGAFIPVEH